MKNKEFIQAVVNHYKTAIKQLDIPGVYLSKTGRLLRQNTNGDAYAIIKKKGLTNGNQDFDNYVYCGDEFMKLWEANKKEIKEIFLKNSYYFTGAYSMYGEAFYKKFQA
jgi:hypothetical protein